MIFAAGLGTRLKPLTDSMPKALVPVDGKTLLDITINRLVAAGATEIVVNVHHFGEQIIAHLQQHSYPVPVRISDERSQLLDTGGGLRQAVPLFGAPDGPVLLHNVDILHNADLSAFCAASDASGITLMVSDRPTSRYLLFNDDLRLVGWTNVQTGEVRSPYDALDISSLRRYAFSGIHCFSPAVFPLLQDWPSRFPIMDFYLRECARIPIKAWPVEGLRLLDVGKTDSLSAATEFLRSMS